MYHYYFLSSQCHRCNNKERSLALKMGMARTWEGKDKAFTKFHLKEAPRRDALDTTAKNIVTGKIVTQVTCAMYKQTSQKLAWSTAGVTFLVRVVFPKGVGHRGYR